MHKLRLLHLSYLCEQLPRRTWRDRSKEPCGVKTAGLFFLFISNHLFVTVDKFLHESCDRGSLSDTDSVTSCFEFICQSPFHLKTLCDNTLTFFILLCSNRLWFWHVNQLLFSFSFNMSASSSFPAPKQIIIIPNFINMIFLLSTLNKKTRCGKIEKGDEGITPFQSVKSAI